MRTTLGFLAFVMLAMAGPGKAQAQGGQAVRFVGIHPISADHGGGFCYIEVPHVHVYTPTRADVLYRKHDDGYYFVGDPLPYGYQGPKQAYYGPHPIHVDYVLGDAGDDTEYCYIDGPHYHPFAPEPQATFQLKGGVYFFTGDLPRAYVEARPRYAKINAVYKPLVYQRPVVVVSPPPEYRGPIYVEADPEPPPAVYVEPATVVVPAHVGVGVGVHAGVGFSAGVNLGVGIVAPPPTVVEVRPRRTTYIVQEEPDVRVIRVKGGKWKHDNGRHRGHDRGRWR